ncbi:unnamed protein product, partial [Staurois parvus]
RGGLTIRALGYCPRARAIGGPHEGLYGPLCGCGLSVGGDTWGPMISYCPGAQ